MDFEKKNSELILRSAATIALAGFFVGVARDLDARYRPLREAAERISYSMLAIIGFAIVIGVVVLTEIWRPAFFIPLRRIRTRLGWTRWILVGLVGLISSTFFLIKWSENFHGLYLRLLLTLSIFGVATWLASNKEDSSFNWSGLLAGGILVASVFAFCKAFQVAVNYPFSLTWSEGNRIWDYSVLWGRRLYIYPPDKPIKAYIDPGRQGLWGLPFLLPWVSIRLVRYWSAFVFTVPYAILGWLLIKPQKGEMGCWFLFGLWSFLFLDQGPIYTPLVLAAIVVAGARRAPTWLAFIMVALAGYYARSSRVTWMFAPAMWAGMISLVEVSPCGVRNTTQRWIRAVTLVVGGLVGGYGFPELLPQIRSWSMGTVAATGITSVEGVSTLLGRQPLLWDRLWPNPTYPEGIVLGLLLATGPLIVLLISFEIRGHWRLNFWQKVAIIGGLIAFLIVGIIISVKIGGGSNLHNLDMFLIGLLFTAYLAWEAGAKEWFDTSKSRTWLINLLILAAIFYPASNRLMKAETFMLPPQDEIREALEAVQQAVAEFKDQGEVLFIDQRQLLTFSYVPDVPLVPEYEKKLIMDQAMAADSLYFEDFYTDLNSHRFSLIISEPLRVQFQGDTYEFGNENDAWVYWVSIPVLCNYEPVETFERFGTQILIPRKEPLVDPAVTCPDL